MNFPANILYGLAALFGCLGLFGMLMPVIGVPLLLLAYLCYLLAGKAKRKARELQVKRSLQ